MNLSRSSWFVRFMRVFLCLILLGSGFSNNPAPVKAMSGVPQLIGPLTGTVVYSTPEEPRAIPIFRWQPLAEADLYRIQISSAIGFNVDTMLYEVETYNTAFVPFIYQIPDNAEIFWRVQSVDIVSGKKVYGVFSEIQVIEKNWLVRKEGANLVDNRPELLLPFDGSTIPYNDQAGQVNRPSFSWKPVPGANKYRLEFSLDSSFNSVSYSYLTVTPSYQLDRKLSDNTYYWRVTPLIDYYLKGRWYVMVGRESVINTVTFNYNSQYIPQLITPDDNVDLAFTPTLRWTPVRGAEYYEVQLSTSSLFPEPATKTYANSYTSPVPLRNDTNYFWRVRAISGSSNTPIWSTVRTFFKRWYEPPKLLTPTEGYQYGNEPYFSWTPVEGAAKYYIEFSPNNTFSNKVVKNTTDTFFGADSGYNCPPVSTLVTKVYWRVIPEDSEGNQGDASISYSFDCNKTAGAPVLVHPRYYYEPIPEKINPYEDLTVAQPLFLWKRLNWVDPEGISLPFEGYRIEVYSDPYRNNKVWSLDTKNMSAIPMDKDLMPTGVYYWRVRPLDFDGSSATEVGQWSQFWKMRLNTALLPTPTTGASVDLLRPIHGSEWAELVPPFEWLPVSGANSYQVEISTSPDAQTFEDPRFLILNSNNLPGQPVEYPSYTYHESLPFGTYYWRVRANLNSGPGQWSTIYRFQVAAQSRFRPIRTLGMNTSPIVASDTAAATDMTNTNYDVDTLAVTQDQFDWFFNFDAQVSPEDMRYVIYIDSDHIDNSGANVDPEGYSVTTVPAHKPEYAIVVRQIGGVVSKDQTWIYRWLGSTWDTANRLSDMAGGDLLFADGRIEIKARGSYVGMTDLTSSMAAVLFTGRVENGFATGPAQDSVPWDPNVSFTIPQTGPASTVLSRFVSITDRVSPIFPVNKSAKEQGTVWTLPPFTWHAPVDVPLCHYDWRIGVDPKLTSWLKTASKVVPSIFTYNGDVIGDNTYIWEVRPVYRIANCTSSSGYFGGAWSEPNFLVRKAPGATGLVATPDGNMVRFDWTNSEGSEKYELVVDNDPDFSSLIYSVTLEVNHHSPTGTTSGGSPSPNIISGLVDGVTYYWKVRARQYSYDATKPVLDGWSATQSFVINRPVPSGLESIPGSNPENASPFNPSLCWTPEESAYRYFVEVAYDDQFKTIYYSDDTEQSCYTLMVGSRDGTFFWRVRMIDGKNQPGAPSAGSTFTKQYGAPTPLYPKGKVHGTPTFNWTPVPGASLYRLVIMDPYTGAVVKTFETAATSYQPVDPLNMREYKWKVAMLDNVPSPNTNYGPYSNEMLIQDTYYFVGLPALRRK